MIEHNLVFKALGDATRRHLLDQLFEHDGRSLTELESGLAMSRFGASKHLRLLEEAGLVITRRSGREKLHYLNPVPIRLIHDRWIDKYTERRASALTDLKSELEDVPMSTTTTTEPTTEQIYQIFIKATPSAIWDAITRPEFSARYFYGARVETTAEAGTPFRYHSPDGTSLWGDEEVLESDPPRRLVVTWRSLYDPELVDEPASRVTWRIEAQDTGYSLLTVTHDRLEDAPGTAANVSGPGWMMVLSGMKTLLETGAGLAEA